MYMRTTIHNTIASYLATGHANINSGETKTCTIIMTTYQHQNKIEDRLRTIHEGGEIKLSFSSFVFLSRILSFNHVLKPLL